MRGTKPLDSHEPRKIAERFDDTFAVRNRPLSVRGVSTGGHASELLSLRVKDVWQNNQPVTDLPFDRSVVKGEEVSRAVPVNADQNGAKIYCNPAK